MNKKSIIIILIAAATVGLGFYLFKLNGTPTITGNQNAQNQNQPQNVLASIPDDAQLKQNLQKAGLDILSREGTALHTHQHIDIIINGQNFPVPADIGIGNYFISPLHIHDGTGILHVESPVIKDFKLGQFFTEWGVNFNSQCIGNYCADEAHKLITAINGRPITDPANYVLNAHDEIEIWFGPKTDSPALIKSYNFPQGL